MTSIHRVPKFCSQCSFELKLNFIHEEKEERLFCRRCGYISYLNPFLVAGAIIEDRGKILLIRRGIEPMRHLWTFPAGFVELGESVESGAVREAREETGIKIGLKDVIGIYSYPDHGVATVVYRARLIGGKIRVSREAEEIRMFSRAEIPWKNLAFRSTTDALKDWARGMPHKVRC